MFKLHVYSQTGDLDQEVEIEGDTVIIGRSSDCHVVIDRKDISRRHARLLCGWVVDDLSSRNGTHVEGVRIEEATVVPARSFEVGDASGQNLVTIEVVGVAPRSRQDRETSNPEVMEPSGHGGLPLGEYTPPPPSDPHGLSAEERCVALEAEAARYRYKCAKLELELEQLRKQVASADKGGAPGKTSQKRSPEPPRGDGRDTI